MAENPAVRLPSGSGIGHHQRMADPPRPLTLFALGRRGLTTGLTVVAVLNGIVMAGARWAHLAVWADRHG